MLSPHIAIIHFFLALLLAFALTASASPIARTEDTSPALDPALDPRSFEAAAPLINSLCMKATGKSS